MNFVTQTSVRLPSLQRISKMAVSSNVLRDISDELVAQTKRNILTGGGVWGKWKPMAPNTRYKNLVFGKENRLLRGLERFIFGRQTGTTASVAANSDLVRYHHEGRDGRWLIAGKGTKLYFPMLPGGGAKTFKAKSPTPAFKGGARASYRISPKGKAYQSPFLQGKGGRFVSPYKYGNRKYNWYSGPVVYHKGYPARQIFPTPEQAAGIARGIADRWIQAMVRG